MKSELKAAVLILAGIFAGIAHGGEVQITVSDLEGRPLQDAVVYVEKAGDTGKPTAQHPHATIDQVNREFVPLVSVVQTGTQVDFPTSANIRHSIYSFSPAKVFTTKLYSGKQAPPVVFDQPGVVVLGCNIHDVMVGWVLVVNTSLFSKSGADGKVILHGVEPAAYRLNVWYPGIRPDVAVSDLLMAAEPIDREVRIDVAGSPLPGLRERALGKQHTQP